ncbi:hypothetical protein, partial [Methylacidiphilum kamchatkense]|uniref:hypothetical protein n=1 Tax=Methylacidiphilum kamchatkense TaxID=431057 RepID=UPI001F25241B
EKRLYFVLFAEVDDLTCPLVTEITRIGRLQRNVSFAPLRPSLRQRREPFAQRKRFFWISPSCLLCNRFRERIPRPETTSALPSLDTIAA